MFLKKLIKMTIGTCFYLGVLSLAYFFPNYAWAVKTFFTVLWIVILSCYILLLFNIEVYNDAMNNYYNGFLVFVGFSTDIVLAIAFIILDFRFIFILQVLITLVYIIIKTHQKEYLNGVRHEKRENSRNI